MYQNFIVKSHIDYNLDDKIQVTQSDVNQMSESYNTIISESYNKEIITPEEEQSINNFENEGGNIATRYGVDGRVVACGNLGLFF